MRPTEEEIECLRLSAKLGGKFYLYKSSTIYRIKELSKDYPGYYEGVQCSYDIYTGSFDDRILAAIPIEQVEETFSIEEVITKHLSLWVA